jgi:hypothetical protein
MAIAVRGIKISDWNKMTPSEQDIVFNDLCQRAKEPTLDQLKENLLALEERIYTLGLCYKMSIEDIDSFLKGYCIDHLNATVDTCTLNKLREDKNNAEQKIKTRAESIALLHGDS